MRHTLWLMALSVSIAAAVAAQDKPDFSGHWVLEPAVDSPSDAALSLTVRQPVFERPLWARR